MPRHKTAIGVALIMLWSPSRASITEGVVLPPMEFSKVGGGNIRTDTLKGKVSVLVFWGSWSKPSRALLPHIAGIQKTLGAKTLQVLAVAMDDNEASVQRYANENNIRLPLAVCGRTEAKRLASEIGMGAVPRIFVVDSSGIVRYARTGFVPGSERELGMAVRRCLAASGGK